MRWHNFSSLAIVPVTVISSTTRQAPTDLVPYHPTYNGVVLFKNTFDGQLPAADYPKINVSSPGVIYALQLTHFARSFTSSCSSRMHSLHVAGHGYATSIRWTCCPSKYVKYISRVVGIVKSAYRSITCPVWWGSWSSRWQQIGVRLPDALTYFGLMKYSVLSLPQCPWQKCCRSALPFRWLECNSRNTWQPGLK